MRIVKWNPQERVDTPDLTAMSYLVLGEFRRTARGVLLGDAASSPNYIINGFAVEEAAVPDTTIRVRLDIAGALSYAFGAELIGSRVDYGQVIGGDDSNGNTEGNATQTLDFTGEPAATYTVQMRFVYTDGTSDNRAFWNATGNTEFISAVNTRTLSGFELRHSGAASNEWIDLADVVWDGVGPIGSADITDLREFALEGTAPYYATTPLGSGGMANFSRALTRGSNGINAVYPALRALARQIQDIKGADDFGLWNWFNTAYRPGDPSSSLGFDKATNLRSLRTTHFTVGDGVNTYGDFYGTALGSGLDECLAHIETEQANFTNNHIVVTILDENDSTYNIAERAFTDVGVEIVGVGGGTARRVTVNHSTVAAGTAVFDMTGQRLILRNIALESGLTDANRAGITTTSKLELHNCAINPGLESGNETNSTVYAINYDSALEPIWRDSTITGRVSIDHPGATNLVMGQIEGCNFESTCVEIPAASNAIRFVNCEFDDLLDGYAAAAVAGAGNIQITNNVSHVYFESCTFRNQGNETDAVRIEGSSLIGPTDISFNNCIFDFSAGSTREPDTGANGANGTGWGIFIDDGSSTSDGRHITVTDCDFEGANMIDAGGIFCEGVTHLKVRGCNFNGFGANSAPTGQTRVMCIDLDGTGATDTRFIVEGNSFANWSSTSSATDLYYAIRVQDADNAIVSGNQFDGNDSAGSVIDGAAAACAIEVTDSEYIHIQNNAFANFQSDTTDRRGIKFVSPASPHATIVGNSFHVCGQAPIDLSGGSTSNHAVISHNAFQNTSATGCVGIELGASCTNVSMCGNTLSTVVDADIIELNGADDNIYIGNAGLSAGGNCDINRSGGTGNLGTTANNQVTAVNA